MRSHTVTQYLRLTKIFRTCCLSFGVPPHLSTALASGVVGHHISRRPWSLCHPYQSSCSALSWYNASHTSAFHVVLGFPELVCRLQNNSNCGKYEIGENILVKHSHAGSRVEKQDVTARLGGPRICLWVVDKNCFYFSRVLPLVLLLKNANKETDPLCLWS